MPEIVIVDDDGDLREVLVEALSASGYHARAVGSVAELLALYAPEVAPPSLILVDEIMPEAEGRQLVSIIERSPRLGGVPLVVMSASRTSVYGSAGRIEKPFGLDTLMLLVGRYVRLPG